MNVPVKRKRKLSEKGAEMQAAKSRKPLIKLKSSSKSKMVKKAKETKNTSSLCEVGLKDD